CKKGRPDRVRARSVVVPASIASRRPRPAGALETPRMPGSSDDHPTSSARTCVPPPDRVAVAVAVAEVPTLRIPGAVTDRRVRVPPGICSVAPVVSPATRAVSVGAPERSGRTEPGRTTLDTVASEGSELIHSACAVTSTLVPSGPRAIARTRGRVPTATAPAGSSSTREEGGAPVTATDTLRPSTPDEWAQ